MSERFVRVLLSTGPRMHPTLPTWGLYRDQDAYLKPLWSNNMKAVTAEIGFGDSLIGSEAATVLDAEDPAAETPDEAWAALARYRLSQ